MKGFYKKGQRFKLRTHGKKGRIHGFGVVDPFQGKLITKIYRSHNSNDFIDFINSVVSSIPKNKVLYIVLDNDPIHTSHESTQFLKLLESKGSIKLNWLPTHSPQLNWIEYLWRDTKDYICGNFVFDSIDELRKAIEQRWLSLSKKDIQRIIGLNTRLEKLLGKI